MRTRKTTILLALLLVLAVGCSHKTPPPALALAALSKKLGFAVPPDAQLIGYEHKHTKDDSMCCEIWVLRTSKQLSGPNRDVKQSRVKSPLSSLESLVEQLTHEPADLDAAKKSAEYVEWQHGDVMCQMRQANTSTGGAVVVVETVAPH